MTESPPIIHLFKHPKLILSVMLHNQGEKPRATYPPTAAGAGIRGAQVSPSTGAKNTDSRISPANKFLFLWHPMEILSTFISQYHLKKILNEINLA